MKIIVLVALSGALSLTTVGSAHAQTQSAIAEALYRQARDLMAAGNYDEACPKLAESQRLDPATGTLLNLAACHEKQGRFATAWTEYGDAIAAARRDQREDRVDYARQRLTELEPKLSRLTLMLDPGADAPGLSLELDNSALGRAVIGAAMPIDPGSHVVRAMAPGKKPWSLTVEIGALSDQKTLNIPPLEDAPAEPAAAPPVVTTTPPAYGSTGPSKDESGARPIPTSVYLSAGITLALGVAAGVTGVSYLQKKESYEDERAAYLQSRSSSVEAPPDSLSDSERTAQRYGYINLGLWAATAVGAGVSTYLYVTRPTLPMSASARVLPWASSEGAGLSVTGGF